MKLIFIDSDEFSQQFVSPFGSSSDETFFPTLRTRFHVLSAAFNFICDGMAEGRFLSTHPEYQEEIADFRVRIQNEPWAECVRLQSLTERRECSDRSAVAAAESGTGEMATKEDGRHGTAMRDVVRDGEQLILHAISPHLCF